MSCESSKESPSGSPTSVVRQFATLVDDDDKECSSSKMVEQGKNGLFSSLSERNEDDNKSQLLFTVRNCILQVGVSAGQLCATAMTWPKNNYNNINNNDDDDDASLLTASLAKLFRDLHATASALDLNLHLAVEAKMQLNAKKYPVELCKGKAGKYTQYSAVTGVTKVNQSTTADACAHQAVPMPTLVSALPALVAKVHEFATARSWAQFHTPRNLVLALMGEVGELAELLQWKGDDHKNDNGDDLLSAVELDKLSQELADVAIYSMRIATVCGVVQPVCDALLLLEEEGSDDNVSKS